MLLPDLTTTIHHVSTVSKFVVSSKDQGQDTEEDEVELKMKIVGLRQYMSVIEAGATLILKVVDVHASGEPHSGVTRTALVASRYDEDTVTPILIRLRDLLVEESTATQCLTQKQQSTAPVT